MLLEFKSDLQTFVVSHLPVKAIIHQCIGDLSPSNEDLIQMSTQLVGDGAWVDSTGEIEEVELTVEVGDVVVKIPTYYHHCSCILLLISLTISITLFALSVLKFSSPGSR